MLEHRRGLEPKTERVERAGFRHAQPSYQRHLRENSRAAIGAAPIHCVERR
jgi:hypothetical protein